MSKYKRKNRQQATPALELSGRTLWILLAAAVLILTGALIRNRSSIFPANKPAVTQSLVQETATPQLEYQGASICQTQPAFLNELGFAGKTIGGTSLTGYIGFVIVEQDEAGDYQQVYQHPSWTAAGYLGPFVRDQHGNTYTAPTPFSSVELNPPEKQNRVYKIDTHSGEMAEFVNLPAALSPSPANPYGVMGLFYDCDTNSLYAASIAGSTAEAVVGRVFRIDSVAGGIEDQWSAGMDILGVGVFNGVHGKRLYMGSARDSGIFSIALDEEGNFSGEPRLEFYLAGLEGGDNDKAQRFTFTPEGEMVIKGIDFNYNLSASSEPHCNLYHMTYLPESDSWQLKTIDRVA
jgi:hypothetical protein